MAKKNLSDNNFDSVIIITTPDKTLVYGTYKTKDQVTKAINKICKDWTVKDHHYNKVDIKIVRKP